MSAPSPYRWLVCLGRGSSGEVWGVEKDGQPMAVKVLTDTRPGSPHAEAIRREMHLGPILADHPGIVAVRNVAEPGGVLHLEMDWVRGPSLEQVIEGRRGSGHGPVPADVAVLWMRQVLEALRWAATTVAPQDPGSFVHRDLKPANLLLEPGSGRVRITDFGMARAATEMGFQTTETGIVKGTPRFMSPEVLVEHENDHRADQFSVGAVLYELVTGRPLYEAYTLAEVLTAAMKADVSRQLIDVAKHHPDLSKVLKVLLAKDPERRYEDHGAASAALAELVGDPRAIVRYLPQILEDANGPAEPTGQVLSGPDLRPMLFAAPSARSLAAQIDDESTLIASDGWPQLPRDPALPTLGEHVAELADLPDRPEPTYEVTQPSLNPANELPGFEPREGTMPIVEGTAPIEFTDAIGGNEDATEPIPPEEIQAALAADNEDSMTLVSSGIDAMLAEVSLPDPTDPSVTLPEPEAELSLPIPEPDSERSLSLPVPEPDTERSLSLPIPEAGLDLDPDSELSLELDADAELSLELDADSEVSLPAPVSRPRGDAEATVLLQRPGRRQEGTSPAVVAATVLVVLATLLVSVVAILAIAVATMTFLGS